MLSSEIPAVVPDHSKRRDLWILALVFGALNFFALGSHPLANPDEGRYAEIPREMLATGDWVTPRLNGVPYFEKPPLVYWLVAICEKVFGQSELSVRLVPAAFGLWGVFLAYLAARRLFGREAGVASAVALGTAVLYFGLSRLLIIDMAVSVLMTQALLAFIVGMQFPAGPIRRRIFYVMYGSMALATLAKGLIGFFVTGAVMFFWLLLCDQWKKLRPLYLPTGALLFLVIALPWHVLVAQRNPEWANFYFIHEHWERFTTTEHGRYQPFWFYLPILILGFFPWVGFLWAAGGAALAGGWAQRRERATLWFFVVWAAFIFLFFSKSQSKLIPYILPVFPPLAIIVGAWLGGVWREGIRPGVRAGLRIFAFFSGLLAVGAVFAVVRPGIIREPGQLASIRPWAFPMAGILFAGGIAAPWALTMRGARAALVTMTSATVAFLLLLSLAIPDIRGTRPLGMVARDSIPAEEAIFHYHAFFHDFTFYAGRTVGLVDYQDELELPFADATARAQRFVDEAEWRRRWSGPQRSWLVVRHTDLAPLLADPTFHYHLLEETPTHSLLSNRP